MKNRYIIIFLLITVPMYLFGCIGMYESSRLIVSIRSEDISDVKSLIAAGEDVNALSLDFIDQRPWKLTPLIRASMLGNLEIIEMLLKAGAKVDAQDEWGDTALMAAVGYGHIEAAKLLLDYSADVNATKPNLTTALMIAARKGNLEIVKLLLNANADVNIGQGSGGTALSLAAWNGHLTVMEALIEKGADVNQRDTNNQPLLNKFLKPNQAAIAKLLIKSGANINERDGSPPLIGAAYLGNTELVRVLLVHGADVNARLKSTDNYADNSTALHFAAIKGHRYTVKALIESGCDIDAQAKNGNTALILAAMEGHTETVKTLLSAGANPNIKNVKGRSAQDFAKVGKHEDIIKTITEYITENFNVTVTTNLSNVSQSELERVKKEAKHALSSICSLLRTRKRESLEVIIVDGGIVRAKGGTIYLPEWHVRNKKAGIVNIISQISLNHQENNFFKIGMSVYLQKRYGEDHGFPNFSGEPLDNLVRDYKDQLIPIHELANNNEIFRELGTTKRKIAFIEAGSFIGFLVEKYGEQKLRELHNSLSLDYEKVYGKNLKELEVEWNGFVFRNHIYR